MIRPFILHAASGGSSRAEVRAEERQLFERRMGAEWARIARLAHRLSGWSLGPADADDIVQDVFLAAWQRRADHRGDASWSTWVHAIAVRTVGRAMRSRERRRRWFGRLLPGPELEAAGAADGPAPGDGAGAALRLAMGRLRHADREVLVLHYLEGAGTDEVAERLELTPEALRARLSRARRRLREVMGPEAAHDPARPAEDLP